MKKILHTVDWYVQVGFLVSLIMIVAGFIIPPAGVVDGSVLVAFGEVNGFAALFVFLFKLPEYIEKGMTAHFKKGDIEVTVGADEDENK